MSTVYEPLAGENITETAERMVELAKESGGSVTASFNDIELLAADPDAIPQAIVDHYHEESNRRAEEYRNSPEYAAAQERARLRQVAEDAACNAALATAPEHMTLRDPDGWQQAVAANQDPYGAAVMRHAERWARIMEARINAGAPLTDIADDASHVADNEGITGFMYGCAVSILAQVWTHGEALRRWHNRATQIGTEGDKANETGGVLNPALRQIGEKD